MSETIVADPAAILPDRTPVDLTRFVAESGPDWGEAAIEQVLAPATIGQVPIDYTVPNRVVRIPLLLLDRDGHTFAEIRSVIQALVARWQHDGGCIGRTIETRTSTRTVYADVVDAALRLGGSTEQALYDIDADAELVIETLPDWYEDEVELDVMRGTGEIVGALQQDGRDAVIAGDFPRGNRCRAVVRDTSGTAQMGLIAAFRGRNYDPSPTAALSYEAESLLALDMASAVALSGASGGTVVKHPSLATSWTPVVGGAAVAAAPTIRGVGAVASGTAGVSPALPTGTLVNDVLVMFLETGNEVVTPPAGWAHVTGSPVAMASGAATRLTVLWKRATTTEAAPSVGDPGDHVVARIIGVSGCPASGDPCDVTATGTESSADTSVSVPGGTTTVPNCLVLAAVATGTDVASTAHASAWANADLTSVTEQIDNWVADGNGGGIGVASGVKAAAGAYAATTATVVTSATKAMMSLALKPVQPMTHVGNYRVFARLHSRAGSAVAARFVYDVGDLVNPEENRRWTFPGANDLYLADLGEARVQAGSGEHMWAWQIQALGAAGGEDISVDKVHFVPTDEFMARLSAPLNIARGLSTYVARDEFNQSAGGLNGKAASVGGAWATIGGGATDIVVDAGAHVASRSALDSQQWRFAVLGSTMTGMAVACDATLSAGVFDEFALGAVVARWTDFSHNLALVVSWAAGTFEIWKENSGTTVLAAGRFAVDAVLRAVPLLLVVEPDGRWLASIDGVVRAAGYDADLAAGGALASGKAGFGDHGGVQATTRTYDNFAAWVPAADAVLYPRQTAVLATASRPGERPFERAGETGVSYGPISDAVGNTPRLPNSGPEDAPVEAFFKNSRGPVGISTSAPQLPDSASDALEVQPFYRPCWLNVPE